jgi:acylphosphatase
MRRHLFYSGRVQGVGFRYTAQRIARSFAVTGWVRNLPDGRVELIVEGDSMAGNIDGVEQLDEAATGEFSGFQITG